jgi:hypothetical protein
MRVNVVRGLGAIASGGRQKKSGAKRTPSQNHADFSRRVVLHNFCVREFCVRSGSWGHSPSHLHQSDAFISALGAEEFEGASEVVGVG